MLDVGCWDLSSGILFDYLGLCSLSFLQGEFSEVNVCGKKKRRGKRKMTHLVGVEKERGREKKREMDDIKF